jgi:hypothetical protein
LVSVSLDKKLIIWDGREEAMQFLSSNLTLQEVKPKG